MSKIRGTVRGFALPRWSEVASLNSLTVPRITRTPTPYASTLVPTLRVDAPVIVRAPTLFTPTVVARLVIGAPVISRTPALYAPALLVTISLTPPQITRIPALYVPTITIPTLQTIAVSRITRTPQLFTPVLAAPFTARTLTAPRINRAAYAYAPNLGLRTELATLRDPNPYPPTIPESIRDLSPDLYEYLAYQARTLRQESSKLQSGASAWPIEYLTLFGSEAIYAPGSKGRFLHPNYGILRAVYVEFGSMLGLPGAPVGLTVSSDWIVTNNITLSAASRALGVLPGGVPAAGQFGWVLTDGFNLLSLTLSSGSLENGRELVWSGNGTVSYTADGVVLGRVVANSLSAGGVMIGVGTGNGASAAAGFSQRITTLETTVADTTSRISLIETATASGSIASGSTVSALSSSLAAVTADLATTQQTYVTADQALAKQIINLSVQFSANINAQIASTIQTISNGQISQAAINDQLSAKFGLANSAAANALMQTQLLATSNQVTVTQVSSLFAQLNDDIAGLSATATSLTTLTATINNGSTGLVATATRVSALETTVNDGTTGLVATRARLITEETTRTTADTALATRATNLEATVNTGTNANATLRTDLTTTATAQSATASSLTTLSTTVGNNTASITTLNTSMSGVQAKYSVTIDANGSVTGYQLVGGGGVSAFNVRADQIKFYGPGGVGGLAPFAVDTTTGEVKIAGRIVIDTGTYMLVQGQGFGTSSQFVQWYGVKMALNLCSESNAIFYLKNNGAAYYAGGFSAGTLTTKAATSSTSASAETETAVYGSNAGTITISISVTVSYSSRIDYLSSQLSNFNTDKGTVTPTPTSPGSDAWSIPAQTISGAGTVELRRSLNGAAYSLVGTYTLSGTRCWEGTAPNGSDPGYSLRTASITGSFTYTDPSTIAQSRRYKLTMTARNLYWGIVANDQTLSIVSVEV